MQQNPQQWDEFQWERFLRMRERRQETIMLYSLRSRNPWRFGQMWSGFQSEPLPDEEEQEDFLYSETDGDEWKITTHPCYRNVSESLEYIRGVLDELPSHKRLHAAVVELIARSESIPYLLATGLTLGEAYNSKGGTIAYCKRALHLTNESLDYLKELGNEFVVSPEQYATVIRQCTTARNEIGCFISDIRMGGSISPFA